jgi:hypothetical protein
MKPIIAESEAKDSVPLFIDRVFGSNPTSVWLTAYCKPYSEECFYLKFGTFLQYVIPSLISFIMVSIALLFGKFVKQFYT